MLPKGLVRSRRLGLDVTIARGGGRGLLGTNGAAAVSNPPHRELMTLPVIPHHDGGGDDNNDDGGDENILAFIARRVMASTVSSRTSTTLGCPRLRSHAAARGRGTYGNAEEAALRAPKRRRPARVRGEVGGDEDGAA